MRDILHYDDRLERMIHKANREMWDKMQAPNIRIVYKQYKDKKK
ncbi:hypothetical protein PJ261_07780 [Streptococcus dysgalactiae]